MTATIVELDMCPINSAVDGLRRVNTHDVRGCVAVTIDRDGVYAYGCCDMTPEQMLAAAEYLRRQAAHEIMDREHKEPT